MLYMKKKQYFLQGFVSLMGLVSVGGSIFFSYGFCSYFGLAFGPLHNIIPFLLLGIGNYILLPFFDAF